MLQKSKKINITDDLREQLSYEGLPMPVMTSVSSFDDYFNHQWQCHWHEEFEFDYVISGCFEYTIITTKGYSEKIVVEAGDGFFLNSGILHSLKQLTPGSKLSDIVFKPDFFDNPSFGNTYVSCILPLSSGPYAQPLYSDNQLNTSILKAFDTFQYLDYKDPYFGLTCTELICKIVKLMNELLADTPKSLDDVSNVRTIRLRIMLSYIHTHYSEKISAEDIASSALISRTEAFRCFRSCLFQSPIDYLLMFRLNKAADLLSKTSMSIEDICTATGFGSSSYFGKMFKRKCGFSPREYRNKSR